MNPSTSKKYWAHTRLYDVFGMRATMSNERKKEKNSQRERGALKPKGFSSVGTFMCQQDCRLFILHFTFGIKVLISFHVLKQQTTLFLIKHLRFEMSRVRSLQVLKLDIKMNVCLFCLTKNLRIRFFKAVICFLCPVSAYCSLT